MAEHLRARWFRSCPLQEKVNSGKLRSEKVASSSKLLLPISRTCRLRPDSTISDFCFARWGVPNAGAKPLAMRRLQQLHQHIHGIDQQDVGVGFVPSSIHAGVISPFTPA